MKHNHYLILVCILLSISCKRDADKLANLGPIYVTTEEPFSISSSPVDFSIADVNFNAKLTKISSWQIEIKGLTSGAVKRFSGMSQYIDITNSLWDGSSDTTVIFVTEQCVANLYLPVSGVTKTIYFDISIYNGPFALTEVFAINATPINFGSSVYFTAVFNKFKSWKITVTGSTSGAVKRFVGSSKKILESNTAWDGSSDTVFFFRSETCQAVLSFPDTNYTETINFTISVPKIHSGYLINDFESGAFGTYLGSNSGTYWDAPDQASSTIDIINFTPSPQGTNVLHFDCNDVTANYYTGGVYHNSAASNYGIPSMSNDSLYLNLFIYGYPSGNASLSIAVQENDGDIWQPTQINIDWTGWKLVSLKYSGMSNNNGTGNIVKESAKINAINLSMNSIPQGLNCRTLVDYVIFTRGNPLKP